MQKARADMSNELYQRIQGIGYRNQVIPKNIQTFLNDSNVMISIIGLPNVGFRVLHKEKE